MNNVKLEVWNKGPYIKAPDFCPYKFSELIPSEWIGKKEDFVDIVHSNLCPLCKLCNFSSTILEKEIGVRTDKFIEYLTLINNEVAALINNQNSYLRKKDRIPLVILINPEVFDMMLKLVYKDDEKESNQVRAYFLNNEIPICFILGCPVYLSRKLTKVKTMVVGEVEWK